MINKPLHIVSSADIENLVVNNVLEKRTLEYKAQLPDNSDGAKKEFLADVSSLANSIGGDLIFGIKETGGVIEQNYGMVINNADAEIARLENIIREGISPRVSAEIVSVQVENSKIVIIIRIKSSLESPHRVIYKSHDKFYARNSNGKYSMDVLELRSAFAQTSAIAERIKIFSRKRVYEMWRDANQSIATFQTPYIGIHIIPLSAFNSSYGINADQLLAIKEGSSPKLSLQPLNSYSWSKRINLNGVMAYTKQRQETKIISYTQLYRNGIVESFDTKILSERNESKILPMYPLEKKLIKFTGENINLLTELGFQSPFYIFLSLVNIQDFTVAVPEGFFASDAEPITVNEVLLPEMIIDNLQEKLEQKFRPIFDMIWNAAGINRSLNFDENNKFID